jgi:hypothetical protein
MIGSSDIMPGLSASKTKMNEGERESTGNDKTQRQPNELDYQNGHFERDKTIRASDQETLSVPEALDCSQPAPNNVAARFLSVSGAAGNSVPSNNANYENCEDSHPSPTSETSSGRKRRIPPGRGLKWCAGGSGGGGRWVDARDEAYLGAEILDRMSQSKKPKCDDQVATAAESPKPLSIRPKNRIIGNGIFISGGRVMMNNAASGGSKITTCTFCGRPFISAHALDVHLSRNQVFVLIKTQCYCSCFSPGQAPFDKFDFSRAEMRRTRRKLNHSVLHRLLAADCLRDLYRQHSSDVEESSNHS